MLMLSLFDRSGVMARPWADAGFTCYCVDIQHPKGERREGNIVFVGADIHRWMPPLCAGISFVAAFPPCTDLAVSGARWFRAKGLHALTRDKFLMQYAPTAASRSPDHRSW